MKDYQTSQYQEPAVKRFRIKGWWGGKRQFVLSQLKPDQEVKHYECAPVPDIKHSINASREQTSKTNAP